MCLCLLICRLLPSQLYPVSQKPPVSGKSCVSCLPPTCQVQSLLLISLVIVVVGGINMDMIIKTEHMPGPGEYVHGSPLGRYLGGKVANTAIAAYRATRRKPTTNAERKSTDSADSMKVSTGLLNNTIVFLNRAVGRDDTGTFLLDQASKKRH